MNAQQATLFPGIEDVPMAMPRVKEPKEPTTEAPVVVSPYMVRVITATTCPREQDRLLLVLDQIGFQDKLAAAAQELLERTKALSACVADVQR